MSARPYASPIKQYLDANGEPLAGGELYSYIGGTSIPAALYTDRAATEPHTNPIILDSSGRAQWYMGGGTYKLILKDAAGNTIWTDDGATVETGGDGDEGLTNPWISHPITDGQAATSLLNETVDLGDYSSAVYDFEITRGTTVKSNGTLAIQDLNGTGRILEGLAIAGEPHGVTFSLSQIGSVVQLRAEVDSGAGDGQIKLKKKEKVPA